MRRTFTFRCQDIMDGAISMQELLSIYPPLKDPEEVCGYVYL